MTTAEHENITPEAFDLMDWIASGTVGRRQVTIYNDVAAGKRLVEIQARLNELAPVDDRDEDGDQPLSASAPPEVAELEAEAADLLDRLDASKAVWTVRAVSKDDVDATFDEVPAPRRPVPSQETTEKARKREEDAFNTWVRASNEANQERRLHLISRAVVSIETVRGAADGATVDQLRAMQSRPHGAQWVDQLHAAVEAATEVEPDVPRPTLPGRSMSSRG